MKLCRIGVAVVLTALSASGCQPANSARHALSAADSTALRAIAERDAAMVLARDFAAMSSGYTDDAVRMPPHAPALVGRAAILTSLQQMPPITAFAFHLLDLQGDGEIAYMRAAWSYTLQPPGSKAIADSGKILVVLRKQADGAWLRVADAWNSDLAAAK